MKKYPIEEKTVEELVAEANRILAAGVTEMTEEEEMEEEDFLEKTQVYQPKRKSAKPERRQNAGRKL